MFDLSVLGNIVGIASALGALWGAIVAARQARKTRADAEQERQRQDQPITIVLQDKSSKQEYVLPVSMRRGHLSRSELMGWLGVAQQDHKDRFELDYLAIRLFFKQLEHIQEGRGPADLTIPATRKEIEQFRIEHERNQSSPQDPEKVDTDEVALQPRPSKTSATSAGA